MKYWLIFGLLLCFSWLSANETRWPLQKTDVREYAFFNRKYAKIHVPGKDSTRLNRFFQKVDTLLKYKNEPVNILHIGGSHVQAGIFPKQMRKNLNPLNDTIQNLCLTYHFIGKNGASVPFYLNCDYLTDTLSVICPDLIIFAIGINDATSRQFSPETFRQNYNQLIETIEQINPDCAFLFITNNDSYRRVTRRKYRVNPNGETARQVFYQLAEEHQGGVWDLFEWMGGLRSMQKWQNAGLSQRDKVHFTHAGYQLIGNQFFNALIDYINE
ncbi:MAG: GDSL-type esterase/lipase family protein [Candidatus Symbiothrix sp.]|jgi:lysophospholipase L1-like esterase|nr:GDSL-type esterase/lipase family protein [Candidatus Symbiothrix sp.]